MSRNIYDYNGDDDDDDNCDDDDDDSADGDDNDDDGSYWCLTPKPCRIKVVFCLF